MRSTISQHRADAYSASVDLITLASHAAAAFSARPEDTEGAARDLLIPAEAALTKAQEVVSHLRARLEQKTGG